MARSGSAAVRNSSRRGRQRGAALILLLTIIILGVAWFTVGALGKAAPSDADREVRTGIALQAAKQALLSHVAQYAARYDNDEPGQLPCPESVALSSPGVASSSCSNVTAAVGRLPWKTLGIDQLRDGWGEPLWYVLSPGFRSAPINFGTPGQLTYNGAANAAVALIIAPGRPLNTLGNPATAPAGCTKVNQQLATRNAASLNPTNFLECGNATGSYANPGISDWSNDRVVSITAAEWADAIAGPVADRLQRQVAPKLAGWDAAELAARGKSWASASPNGFSTPYLPFASTFGDPTTNDYCGDAGLIPAREGLAPIALRGSGTCSTDWSGSLSAVLGLIDLGCVQDGTQLVCSLFQFFGTAPFSATVNATAPNVANSFRGTLRASDISVTGGGTVNSVTLSSFSGTSGAASVSVNVSWPISLALFSFVQINIPDLPDAAVLSDTDVTWFTNNDWQRYTYYAVGSGTTVNAATTCVNPGDAGCLTLTGLPAANGNTNDKKMILALTGRALPGKSQPSGNTTDYLESHTPGSTVYAAQTVSSTFNDRFAACPFQQTPASGTLVVCN